MLRTASIKLDVTTEQAAALCALQAAYAAACNRLVPIVQAHRCWNRVALHQLAYALLRAHTPLGAQMCCNAIFSVCKAYRAQKELGRLGDDVPVPLLHFDRASVHFDKRTYTLRGDAVSLYTLAHRVTVALRPGEHQRRILASGLAKEAELVCRKRLWYFNLVVESEEVEPVASARVMGLDVGEITLAAASTGKVWGGVDYVDAAYTSQTCSVCGALGERVRHRFECSCGLRAHADLNASRNLARIGTGAPLPKAVVNTPDVGSLDLHASP